MGRKLWKTRGFTIAEIIVAVAIMAALVAVLMKGLQSSVKSVRRDIYRSEVRKRLALVVNKVEIALLSGKTLDKSLSNIGLTEEEKKDSFGQDYIFKYIEIAPTKKGNGPAERKIFLFTGSKLKNLGIISEEITFYL